MSKGLREQLLAAFEESGMSLSDLRERSGLDLTLRSLDRKLRGQPGTPDGRPQPLRDTEIEALASALRIQVRFGREGRAA